MLIYGYASGVKYLLSVPYRSSKPLCIAYQVLSVHNAGVFAVAAIMLSVAQKQQTWGWVLTEFKVRTTLPVVQSQRCSCHTTRHKRCSCFAGVLIPKCLIDMMTV